MIFEKVKQWAYRLLDHWAQILSQVPADQLVPLDDINTSTTYRMLHGLALAISGLLPYVPECIVFLTAPPPGYGPVSNGALSYTTNQALAGDPTAVAPGSPLLASAPLPAVHVAPLPPVPASSLPPVASPQRGRPPTLRVVSAATASTSNGRAPPPPPPGVRSLPGSMAAAPQRAPYTSDDILLSEGSLFGRPSASRPKSYREPTDSFMLAVKGTSISIEASEDPFWTVVDADPLGWVVLPSIQLSGVELTGRLSPGTSTVLRCYRHSRSGPFQQRRLTLHEWPPELQIRILNTHNHSLLDMGKIRRSEKYKHYKDSYLDLTPHIQAGQSWFKVTFDSPRPIQAPFFVCAQALRAVTVDQLISGLKISRVVSVEESKKFIADSFARNDMVSFEKITLKDPMTLTRIDIPARGSGCLHWGCFDLNVYLSANRNIRTWLCPRCNQSTPFDTIVIDAYFQEALKMFPDEDEIILNSDSSLTSKGKDPSSLRGSESTSRANDSKKVVVIELLDSDDEEEEPPRAPIAMPSPQRTPVSPFNNHAINTSTNPTINTTLNNGASASAGRSNGSQPFTPTHAAPSAQIPLGTTQSSDTSDSRGQSGLGLGGNASGGGDGGDGVFGRGGCLGAPATPQRETTTQGEGTGANGTREGEGEGSGDGYRSPTTANPYYTSPRGLSGGYREESSGARASSEGGGGAAGGTAGRAGGAGGRELGSFAPSSGVGGAPVPQQLRVAPFYFHNAPPAGYHTLQNRMPLHQQHPHAYFPYPHQQAQLHSQHIQHALYQQQQQQQQQQLSRPDFVVNRLPPDAHVSRLVENALPEQVNQFPVAQSLPRVIVSPRSIPAFQPLSQPQQQQLQQQPQVAQPIYNHLHIPQQQPQPQQAPSNDVRHFQVPLVNHLSSTTTSPPVPASAPSTPSYMSDSSATESGPLLSTAATALQPAEFIPSNSALATTDSTPVEPTTVLEQAPASLVEVPSKPIVASSSTIIHQFMKRFSTPSTTTAPNPDASDVILCLDSDEE